MPALPDEIWRKILIMTSEFGLKSWSRLEQVSPQFREIAKAELWSTVSELQVTLQHEGVEEDEEACQPEDPKPTLDIKVAVNGLPFGMDEAGRRWIGACKAVLQRCGGNISKVHLQCHYPRGPASELAEEQMAADRSILDCLSTWTLEENSVVSLTVSHLYNHMVESVAKIVDNSGLNYLELRCFQHVTFPNMDDNDTRRDYKAC